MKILLISLVLTLGVGLILSGCTLIPGMSSDILAGTSWTLLNLDGQSVESGTQVTITFEDGKIFGTDGCNSYGASYTVNDNRLNVDKNIATTEMACPEPVMQQATAYITALMQVVTYKIDGQQLTLFDAAGKQLATLTR